MQTAFAICCKLSDMGQLHFSVTVELLLHCNWPMFGGNAYQNNTMLLNSYRKFKYKDEQETQLMLAWPTVLPQS